MSHADTNGELERRDLRDVAISMLGAGTWEWDVPSGSFTLSPGLLAMLGYEPGDVPETRDGLRALLHPDDATAGPSREALFQAGEWRNDHWVRRKDGGLVPIESRGRVIARDASGTPVRVVGVLMDISARIATETALRESERRLAVAIEGAVGGLWDWDLTTDALWTNDQWATMLGYEPDAFSAELGSWKRLLHPDDYDRVMAVTARMLSGAGGSAEFEARMRRADGGWTWILDRGRVVERSADGRPLRAAGLHIDITERKRLEAERDRLATAVAQSFDAVIVAGATGEIAYVNAATERLVGRDAALLVGQPLVDVLGTDAAATEPIRDAVRRNGWWAGDLPLHHDDGAEVTASFRLTRITGPADETLGVIATARDVTRERVLEAKIAEAARMEAIGRLAGGVAHDFNNILSVIMGFADLGLLETGADGPLHEELRQIRLASERAQALTRQLLVFGRRAVLRPSNVRLGDAISGLEPMLRRLIGEDVALVIERGAEPPAVHVDRALLEHAVTNLVLNARDALPDGGTIRVAVGTAREADEVPAGWAALRVADDGSGMTGEVASRIFEPFFTTKEVGRGTGLGLPSVQGFVAQSGGVIRLETEPGKGSRFSVLLPSAEGAAIDGSVTPPEPGTGSGTILVVEDDDMLRMLTRRLLTNAGYTVLLAPNGQEALEILRSDAQLDLLLSDVVMPGMSGIALVGAARSLRPDLRVVLTSGYTPDEMDRRGLALGEHPFIPKPFDTATLLAVVGSTLRHVEHP